MARYLTFPERRQSSCSLGWGFHSVPRPRPRVSLGSSSTTYPSSCLLQPLFLSYLSSLHLFLDSCPFCLEQGGDCWRQGPVKAGVQGASRLQPTPTSGGFLNQAAGGRLCGWDWKLISQTVHELIRLKVHTRSRLCGTSPSGGERAARTASPLSSINPRVTRTQLHRGNALVSPRGARCPRARGAARRETPGSASTGGGRVAWGDGGGGGGSRQGAGTSRPS